MKKVGKVWVLKTLFLGQKVRQKFGNVQKSLETGFSECSEISEILEIVLFWTFRKLRKNDVKLELQNHEKLVPTQKPTQKFG